MRSQLVGTFVAYLRSTGKDADELIRRCSLPPGVESQTEVSWTLGALYSFLDACEALSDDPFIGLHIAAARPKGEYGLLEYVCRNAATVEGCLVRLSRYAGLINDLIEVSFEVQDDGAVLDHRIPGAPLCVGRHANEFFIAKIVNALRLGCRDEAITPTQVWLAHPAPVDPKPLVDFIGAEVDFDRGSNGIRIKREILDRPFVSADPSLLAILDGVAASQLRERETTLPSLTVRIRQHVRDALVEGLPGIGQVAEALAMSQRTLQRRLADEGTSYQTVVDELRQELARTYMKNPRRPITETAFLLGYGDTSSFLRAFKRWTGMTPNAYRATL